MSGIRRWAPPTWIFFHTFAAKINKTFFEQNRAQCLEIIKMICSCLPCPESTKHAIQFMKRVNMHTVRTKEELINMLTCTYSADMDCNFLKIVSPNNRAFFVLVKFQELYNKKKRLLLP